MRHFVDDDTCNVSMEDGTYKHRIDVTPVDLSIDTTQ